MMNFMTCYLCWNSANIHIIMHELHLYTFLCSIDPMSTACEIPLPHLLTLSTYIRCFCCGPKKAVIDSKACIVAWLRLSNFSESTLVWPVWVARLPGPPLDSPVPSTLWLLISDCVNFYEIHSFPRSLQNNFKHRPTTSLNNWTNSCMWP